MLWRYGKKLSSIRIPNYQEISVEKMEKFYKKENPKDKYKEIKKTYFKRCHSKRYSKIL